MADSFCIRLSVATASYFSGFVVPLVRDVFGGWECLCCGLAISDLDSRARNGSERFPFNFFERIYESNTDKYK